MLTFVLFWYRRWADLSDDEDDTFDGLIKGKYEPETVTGPDLEGMSSPHSLYTLLFVLLCM